ncbi:ATP-binding protein [Actinoallomurus bryophytorum]|nr:ATP-binding protein [Actinoallomurus bryophytorum]
MLMPALPRTVGQARSYTRWLLGTWRLEAMADTVELLVSELVTNAVTKTGITDEDPDYSCLIGKVNPIYLCVSRRVETLLIEVWDVSSTPPLKRTAAKADEGGRGLALVESLSKGWGSVVLETGGKIVWCECLIEDAG